MKTFGRCPDLIRFATLEYQSFPQNYGKSVKTVLGPVKVFFAGKPAEPLAIWPGGPS